MERLRRTEGAHSQGRIQPDPRCDLHFDTSGSTRQRTVLRPVVARSQRTRRSVGAVAFDCVRLVVVRDGSVILCGECPQRPVSVGDIVLIAPDMPVGYEPEARITITTLHLDTDYLIEHLFWQRLDLIPDRDAARDLAAKLNPDPVQVLRLGEREVERLEPILDELVTLTEAGQDAARYFRTHALLLTVLEAIAPHIRHAPVAVPPLTSRERAARVASPRWRAFHPVRREAAQAAALMHSDIAKRWRIEDLAAHACLSPSQSTRVFRDSFGVTPLVYLTILRVQEMARLLRTTDLSMRQICPRVGWINSTHPPAHFRRYYGVNPSEYRRYGQPTASQEGPGVGVARAAKSANESARQPVGRGIAVELSTGKMP